MILSKIALLANRILYYITQPLCLHEDVNNSILLPLLLTILFPNKHYFSNKQIGYVVNKTSIGCVILKLIYRVNIYKSNFMWS